MLVLMMVYPWSMTIIHLEPFDKGIVYLFCEFMIPLYALAILRLVGYGDAELKMFRRCAFTLAGALAVVAATNPWHSQFAIFEVPTPGQPNHMLDVAVAGIGFQLTSVFAAVLVTSTALIAAIRLARSRSIASHVFIGVVLPLAALAAHFNSAIWSLLQQNQINPFFVCTTLALAGFSISAAGNSIVSVLPIAHTKLIDLMPDAIVNVCGDGLVVDCNPAFAKLVGRSSEQIIDQPFADMLPDVSFMEDENAEHHLLSLTDDGQTPSSKTNSRHYDLRITPVENSRESKGDRLIHFRNVTDQITAYHRLQNSERRLHEVNDELARLSTTDSLTGLHNRRHFQDHLDLEMEKFMRGGPPIGLLSIDIDHFKHVNDTYGHQAGDEILTQVARILETQCRAADCLARVGGEEFMVLLATDTQAELAVAAERFRDSVQNHKISIGSKVQLNVTVSIGATLSRGNDTLRELLHRVDQRLYEAKHRGRNVSVASSATGQDAAALSMR